ncbi:MAG: DUF484 family protein [Kangiellaceae bacterium]|nr:DUF484 family protein [Kangiellaceae bacterium]
MNLSQSQALEIKSGQENDRLLEMMDEAKVKQFLLQNPKFLLDNPELLSHIELEYGDGDTFSLVERQVKTLRDKNSQLQGQQIEVLTTAHANEELLILCNQFMRELIDSSSLSKLCTQIVNRLKELFQLDDAAVVLIGNLPDCHSARIYQSADQLKTLLNCQFPDDQPLCGRLGQDAKLALFGEGSYAYQSCALIPLGSNCVHGLIALASKDVERFDPNMGTLFIELISKYITALVIAYERN